MDVERNKIKQELVNDWSGVFFFRTLADLEANNFQYSPSHDLARADQQGGRLVEVASPALTSINSLVQDPQVADQILPLLRKLDIQNVKEMLLQQINAMPSAKVRERVHNAISNIYLLMAKGHEIDDGDKFFMQLNIEDQEAFLKQGMKQLIEIHFTELRRYFLSILNRVRKGRASFEENPLVRDVIVFLCWRTTSDVASLADNPIITSKLLCPENFTVIEDREAVHGWGGNYNEAFKQLSDALSVDLEIKLRIEGWTVPGARYSGIDNWEKPHNEELQLLQIGLFDGMKTLRQKSLSELLVKGTTGELRNYLTRCWQSAKWDTF